MYHMLMNMVSVCLASPWKKKCFCLFLCVFFKQSWVKNKEINTVIQINKNGLQMIQAQGYAWTHLTDIYTDITFCRLTHLQPETNLQFSFTLMCKCRLVINVSRRKLKHTKKCLTQKNAQSHFEDVKQFWHLTGVSMFSVAFVFN